MQYAGNGPRSASALDQHSSSVSGKYFSCFSMKIYVVGTQHMFLFLRKNKKKNEHFLY